jgi:hypothetical protein
LLCPAIGIHLLDFDLFRDPQHAEQPPPRLFNPPPQSPAAFMQF